MFWRDWQYRSSTIACARSLHTAVVKQWLLSSLRYSYG
jgi:hypothetical protein